MNAHVPPIKADEGTVRAFLQIIHERAESALKGADRPGYLQLVAIHPASEGTVANRFRIGDIDGMTQAALTLAERGLNVYVEGRTIAEHASVKGRGEFSDTCAVFGFVVDADADKGKGGTLSIEPSLTV